MTRQPLSWLDAAAWWAFCIVAAVVAGALMGASR